MTSQELMENGSVGRTGEKTAKTTQETLRITKLGTKNNNNGWIHQEEHMKDSQTESEIQSVKTQRLIWIQGFLKST